MAELLLGVNIDHIATLRNARGTAYPDPVQAAFIAEQAGADGITVHLREDRRHITDRDVRILRQTLDTRMNLEMAVTEEMLAKTGLIAMVGKAERGPAGIEAIAKHKAAYLMAVGGAAYLVARAIKGAKVLAFEDLGMEAIYEFEVKDMPVTVAVDSAGTSVHQTGPAEWAQRAAAVSAQR